MHTDARRRRFYVPDLTGERIDLPPDEAHHALHVLRLHPGAAVELFDGRGGSADGTVAEADRRRISVDVEHLHPVQPRSAPQVHLAFAVPKGKRLDWLLEKTTELAAASVQAVTFERSVAGKAELTPAKRHRWEGHCIAAAKQCGLQFLPDIRPPVEVGEFLAAPGEALRLLGATGPDAAPAREALAGYVPPQPVVLLVGPEGGLTDAEHAAACEAGFQAVRLGGTTLRTETAAIALLAAAVGICT